MSKGFQTFVQAVIDTVKNAPFAPELSVEEYDGRYETDQALKISGDETVCFVGLESISPVPIPAHARLDGTFFGELSLLMFIEKRRVSEFDEDRSGGKAVPFDVAMNVFRYLYQTPVTLADDFILSQQAEERFTIKEFSGFENIIRLPNVVVVGGTLTYPIILKTEKL